MSQSMAWEGTHLFLDTWVGWIPKSCTSNRKYTSKLNRCSSSDNRTVFNHWLKRGRERMLYVMWQLAPEWGSSTVSLYHVAWWKCITQHNQATIWEQSERNECNHSTGWLTTRNSVSDALWERLGQCCCRSLLHQKSKQDWPTLSTDPKRSVHSMTYHLPAQKLTNLHRLAYK